MALKEKEYLSAYMRQYYQDNKEKCKEAAKKWMKNNPEKVKEQRKRYRRSPKAIEAKRIYREKNREKLNEYRREYRKKKYAEDPNYWKKISKRDKKKANARAVALGVELLKYCELCGDTSKLERHHNNGYDCPENFLTLCKSCHSKVHNIILK